MQSVNIHEAKTRFSKLLEEVQKGEEIIIAKAGRPIAKLMSYTPARPKVAPPGSMEGEAWCADDFDEPLATLFECLEDGP